MSFCFESDLGKTIDVSISDHLHHLTLKHSLFPVSNKRSWETWRCKENEWHANEAFAGFHQRICIIASLCTCFGTIALSSLWFTGLSCNLVEMGFNWQKYEAWRKHPMLTNNLRHSLPGLGIASVAFVAFVAYDKTIGAGSKGGGHH